MPVGEIALTLLIIIVITAALAHDPLAISLTAAFFTLSVGILASYLSIVIASFAKSWREWYAFFIFVLTASIMIYILSNVWPLRASLYDIAFHTAFAWIAFSVVAVIASSGLWRGLAASKMLAVMIVSEPELPTMSEAP